MLLADGLGDGIVVRTILEGIGQALIDWWWFWLLFAAFLIGAKLVTDWSRRVEARSRGRRR
jgi:hypothetical protein